MKQRTSYNLLIFIKRKKLLKTGKSSIFAKITVNKIRTEFVLKCTINPDIWDYETATAKGKSQDAKLVNEYIN